MHKTTILLVWDTRKLKMLPFTNEVYVPIFARMLKDSSPVEMSRAYTWTWRGIYDA